MPDPIARQDITAVILAGGRSRRMGGLDKGLQLFHGLPLALHAARRVQPQVGAVMLNANRHLAQYQRWGWPVWPDIEPEQPGPLAGFMTGLAHCPTPWLLALPCDTPLFPPDLAQRLAQAASQAAAPLAMAAAPDHAPPCEFKAGTEPARPAGPARPWRVHAVFCLLHRSLLPSLTQFVQGGGRRVQQWSQQQGCALAHFDQPGDDPLAFANANTQTELLALQNTLTATDPS